MTISIKKPVRLASEMLTSIEAAQMLGVSRRYLDKDRHAARQNGTPPAIPYIELGHRTVRYHLNDVLGFLASRRVD
ncbi:helix-turn-helix transcriptional regulator [Thioclava sp.]|uniref:helix-turn-helix transcriptional regulator n=1 Tax=Thioclava sp. TaxID=1933450 RepID=UPI003AA97E0C